MTTKINDWVSESMDKYPYPQVADCAESLLKTIRVLERLANRKHFYLSHCRLLCFDRKPSDGHNHQISVVGDKKIDETYIWQVTGRISNQIINVVAKYIFHTHQDNRSGSGEYHINGKDAYLRADLGGLTLDDIWQDKGKWRKPYKDAIRSTKQGVA